MVQGCSGLPEFHGQGIGSYIIDTLESDVLFLRAERIEIPVSITAVEFYRKKGYEYKNGIKELDDEQHYRLENFPHIYPAGISGTRDCAESDSVMRRTTWKRKLGTGNDFAGTTQLSKAYINIL